MKRVLLSLVCGVALWAAPAKVVAPTEGWISELPVVGIGDGAADLVTAARSFAGPDGEAIILLRLKGAEGTASRLVFEDFALPEGGALYVYSAASDGTRGVQGPFTGAGPLRTGEFQTAGIDAGDIVVELRLAEAQAGLPFRIASVETAEGNGDEVAKDGGDAVHETRMSVFRGMVVEHQVVDGLGIWDGDMILGRIEELEPYEPGKPVRAAGAISSGSYRWPGGTVPYTIDPAMGNQARVTSAINHWNTLLAGHMRLVPRTSETYYLHFKLAASSTCSSYIGYIRMAGQPVNVGDYCSTGNVIHEIGHAIGFYHEHTRSDRDTYVRINTANIQSTATGNFTLQSGSLNPTGYDYGSIMHYPATAFSSNGLPTIETIPAGIPIGQRSGLSSLDVAGAKALYPAATSGGGTTTTPSTVAVTLASSPTGRTLTADGSNVVAPYVASWTPGTPHTVSAPTQTVGNTRYVFRGWSNGGSQTQTITTPTAAATYTANYTVQYRVSGAASGVGTLAMGPASADGFYNSGTAIALTATPGAGACLANWTGVVAVNDFAISLTANQSYNVTAVFQTGSVTVPSGASLPGSVTNLNVPVTATGGCIWKASVSAPWLRITSANSGKGSGTVTLRADQNRTGTARSATLLVNGRPMVVTQASR